MCFDNCVEQKLPEINKQMLYIEYKVECNVCKKLTRVSIEPSERKVICKKCLDTRTTSRSTYVGYSTFWYQHDCGGIRWESLITMA